VEDAAVAEKVGVLSGVLGRGGSVSHPHRRTLLGERSIEKQEAGNARYLLVFWGSVTEIFPGSWRRGKCNSGGGATEMRGENAEKKSHLILCPWGPFRRGKRVKKMDAP